MPSLEGLAASVEIDRLLNEANRDYYSPFSPEELDPQETLAAAKKKLKTKMCRRCKTKLAMYIHRHGHDQGPNSQSRQTCYVSRSSGTSWTSGQAEKGLRLEGLGHRITRNYQHNSVTTSGWCKGVELYDDETVTRAALAGYGSVWELHYGLAMYQKRKRKDSVGAVRRGW